MSQIPGQGLSPESPSKIAQPTEVADAERADLLKAVADCSPEVWRAEVNPWGDGVNFFGCRESRPTQLSDDDLKHVAIPLMLTTDAHDSEAIVLMLDEMERQGLCPQLLSDYYDGMTYTCLTRGSVETVRHGPTRAWAVSLTFVAICGTGYLATAVPTDPTPIQKKSALSVEAEGGKG